MKKIFLISLLLITVIGVSCKKENVFRNPNDFAGTTWKCTVDYGGNPDFEYALLVFPSSTSAEGWSKYQGEDQTCDWTGSFSIIENTIVLSFSDQTITGTIGDNIITLIIDHQSAVFTRQ